MKSLLWLCAFAFLSVRADAASLVCPAAPDLAKEILEMEITGARLSGDSRCKDRSKFPHVKPLQQIHSDEGSMAPVFVHEEKPFRLDGIVELEKGLYQADVTWNVEAPDTPGSAVTEIKDRIVFRVYAGKALDYFESCVGVFSSPETLALRKSCVSDRKLDSVGAATRTSEKATDKKKRIKKKSREHR